jgi:hypothetical protein
MMKNLVRLSKINKTPNFPIRSATAYKWHHVKRFPGLFIKLGGAIFIDVDKLDELLEQGRDR